MTRILLIENEAETQRLVAQCSESLSSTALETIETAREAAACLTQSNWVLWVMTASSAGLDELSLLRQLRQHLRVPVLLLVAAAHDVDGILGLEFGADVYLKKPLNERQLLAQMRALLRRAEDEAQGLLPPLPLRRGALELDEHTRAVRYTGERLDLTLSEYELLRLLLLAEGEPVTRETLSHELLGRELTTTDRSLDVHISNLRRKLSAVTGQDGAHCIRAIRGVGYALTIR